MQDFENIPKCALDWFRAGKGAVLATVVETWGSAPRRTGAQMAVSGDGEIVGSVSGGCVEGAVVAEALDLMQADQSKILEFGVSDGDAFAVGLACGGRIRVLLEPVGGVIEGTLLEELVALRESRIPVACISGPSGKPRLARDGYETRFRLDRSGFEEDGETFVAIHNPPLRLIIVGAVHIAQSLVAMARIAGFDPYIIDPRESFATAERFPGTTLSHDWPDEGVAALGLDARTAMVLLTHDPKLDDPALQQALDSDVFYIGALGSKRTHAARVARLTEQGYSPADIARIHGPVGLDIGAANPAEIASSILAEMISVLRRGA